MVGAGPGKADLITVRGRNILREADVVIYDYLADGRLLDEARPGAELICCGRLAKKGRYSDGSPVRQEEIGRLTVQKANEGKKVVRLKNGDPFVFGRGLEELENLAAAGIDFEVVPGITAGTGAGSLSGIPLTDRRFSSSCVFAAGHEDPGKTESMLDWKAISGMGTVVLYMAVENLGAIASRLIAGGRSGDTPAAVVQDASLITRKVLTGTLDNIENIAKTGGVTPPALIIIGETAAAGEKLNRMRKRRNILFTGLSEERYFLEGDYYHLPLIRIDPLENYDEFDGHIKRTGEFDWIVFASRYGVEYFFKRLAAARLDARALKGIKIAAVGSSTKNRLLDFGIRADLVPRDESSAGLLERLKKENLGGKRVFLPRSDISDKGLEEGIKSLGARVTSSFAYRNAMPEDLPALDFAMFDEIMFTSPSTVRNFKKRYGKAPAHVKVRCIGPVTRREAQRCGLQGIEG